MLICSPYQFSFLKGSLCSPDWPDAHYVLGWSRIQRFVCLGCPSAGINSTHHHIQLSYFLCFFETWPQTVQPDLELGYVAKVNFEPLVPLPPPPKYQGYRLVPPHLTILLS